MLAGFFLLNSLYVFSLNQTVINELWVDVMLFSRSDEVLLTHAVTNANTLMFAYSSIC